MNALVSSLNRTAEAWSIYVLHASWQAAAVGLGVLLLLRFFRRWPAPLRYGLLLIALVKFACPPMLGAPVGLFSRFTSADWQIEHVAELAPFDDGLSHPALPAVPAAANPKEKQRQPIAAEASLETDVFSSATAVVDASRPEPVATLSDPQQVIVSVPQSPAQLSSLPTPLRWQAWLMLLHLTGTVAVCAWITWQFWLLRRLVQGSREIRCGPCYEQLSSLSRKLKLARVPRLLESSEAISPMALGTWRPTVLVPCRVLAGLPQSDVNAVLAHELAHLRRGDVWINWLRLVLVALWWFHPVMWLVSRALRRIHEDCCDDLLLVRGLTNQTDYCDALLRVAARVPRGASAGMALGMAQRLHPLGHRLLRIMDGAVRRRAHLSMGGLCALVLTAGLLLPGLSRRRAEAAPPESEAAAKPAAAKPAVPVAHDSETDDNHAVIAGIVLDTNETPVVGATVWLLGGKWDDTVLQRRAEATTDQRGRFTFTQFSEDELFKPAQGQVLPTVMARDERRRLGWISNLQTPGAKQVRVHLHEVARFQGTLLDSSGKPIAGATIQPQILHALSIRDQGYDGTSLSAELLDEWRTVTGADGGFAMPNLPLDGSLTALVTAAGFGQPKVRWELGRRITLRLEPAGALAGSIELPEGVEKTAALAVDLRRQQAAQVTEELFKLYYFASAPVGEEGRFEFIEVPPGVYVVSLKQNRQGAVYGDPTPPITVPPGQRVADVKLPLNRSVVVRGVAVDNRDKKPVKDVTLRLNDFEPGVLRPYATDETTDADGRFTAYVRPGKLVIQPWLTPPGFLPALGDAPPNGIDAEQDIEVTVEIERSAEVKGIVVDEHGQPVPEAELQLILPRRGFRFDPPASARADAAGEFVLKDVDPADNLPLRARSASAVTDGAVLLSPEQLKQPVRLELREEDVCYLAGRVLDESGRPLARVNVGLSANRAYESERIAIRGLSTSVAVEDIYTDEDGRFTSGPLWPRDSYQASLMVDGYGRAESKRVVGEAGETMDLGTIVLRRNDGFVAGRIVDSSGKPVAGVTVFNSGDGLQPASMVTDVSGQFRLQGLFGGAVYVFARKAGYRFTGLRTSSGTSAIKLTLLAKHEPPPIKQPAPMPADTSPHEKLARWMLEQLWELPEAKNKWVLVRCMARLDAEAATAWSAQLGQPADQQVPIGISEHLLDLARQPNLPIDYDKLVAMAAKFSDDRAYDTLESLAEQTIVRNPERALQLVDAALLRARKLPPPRFASALAKLGALLVRLGRDEAGRKLIDESSDVAEHLGKNWAARQDVIAALAPYDLARAKSLIEPISDTWGRNRLLAGLAAALATHDLDGALATAAQIDGDANANETRNHALMEIAYRIATTQLDDAVRVVSLMDGNGADKVRAEALAWLAVAIAPRDKKRAYKLIDQSLDLFLDHPESFGSWGNYGGRCALAAWVARQAREIAYPDMDSVLMRVLATRPTMRDEYDPIRRLEANVAMALILSFSAPETARQVLAACEPSGQLVGSGFSEIRRGAWVEAWALADPAHAKDIFRKELAAVNKENLDLRTAEIMYAADLLSLVARQWPRHFAVDFGAIWIPGEEWQIKYGRLRP